MALPDSSERRFLPQRLKYSTEQQPKYRARPFTPTRTVVVTTMGRPRRSAPGAVVFFEPGYEPTRGEIQSTLWEAHGGVTLDAQDPLYIGAEKHTNNVGEITAIVEMCVWLHHQVMSKAISSSNHIVIHTDSSYARTSLWGNGRPDRTRLSACLRRCYCIV